MDEEILVRRAAENSRRAIMRASSFERDAEFQYTPQVSHGLDLSDFEGDLNNGLYLATKTEEIGAQLGEFVVASDSTAIFGLDDTNTIIGESGINEMETGNESELRVGVARNNAMEGAKMMREGVMRLVKESSVTGSLRLPTGPEAALFAWETTMVIALILLLRAGVSSTLRWIHARLRASVAYEDSVWECMQRPLETVSVFTVATLLAEAVTRPLAAAGLLRYLRALRELGFIVCATWFLIRWIDRIRSRFAEDSRIDKAQVDATSRIATVATTAVSVLVSLDTVGINVQTVLAFGGIGGVAIGFAGREIISNFFGGFMIYVTRPFTVGEWIRSIEEEELNGTVEDIGWYLTRVRTWDKRPLYIPNSRFSTLIVENGSRMANRRILHTLRLRHEDVPVLPKIVAELTKMLMSHTELDPRQHRMAYVDGFGEYSVMIWLSCYTKSVFLYDFRRVQQEILLKAHDIIRMYGARLATINTRDVRPGIDTDRYGPFGERASYRTPTNEPKVGKTPEPERFKLSDIPGAPFFSRLHVDGMLNNIESGISEESIAAALRMESATPLPNTMPTHTTTNGTTTPVTATTNNNTVTNSNNSEKSRQPTSEAAVAAAAAAAALAAARRNHVRIEENNEAKRKNSESMKDNTEGAAQSGSGSSGSENDGRNGAQTKESGEGKMKISAVRGNKVKDESSSKNSTVSKTADNGASNGTDNESRSVLQSKENDGQMKISAVRGGSKNASVKDETSARNSAVPKAGDAVGGSGTTDKIVGNRTTSAKDEGQMKISAVPKMPEAGSGTAGSSRNNANSKESENQLKMSTNTNTTDSESSPTSATKSEGQMKISAVPKAAKSTNRNEGNDSKVKSNTSTSKTTDGGGGGETSNRFAEGKGEVKFTAVFYKDGKKSGEESGGSGGTGKRSENEVEKKQTEDSDDTKTTSSG